MTTTTMTTMTTKAPCCLCGLPRGKRHNRTTCNKIVLNKAARLEFLARWNLKHAN